jgi:hypothetical protein
MWIYEECFARARLQLGNDALKPHLKLCQLVRLLLRKLVVLVLE